MTITRSASGPTVIGSEVTAVSDRLPVPAGGPALGVWLSTLGLVASRPANRTCERDDPRPSGLVASRPANRPCERDDPRPSEPAGRVLVLGPHSESILAALPAGTSVTWLVRSHDDSLELASALGAGVDVRCGSLARLAGPAAFDAVIALDGIDRLSSAESVAPTWEDAVRTIVAVLRPGGILALGVPNSIGLEQLLTGGSRRKDTTAARGRPVDLDATHPASPERLTESLAELGLVATRVWAGYPTAKQPSVLADLAVFDSELARAGTLGSVLATACVAAEDGQVTLADPTRLLRVAARGGAGAHLASGWFVAARRHAGSIAAGAPSLVVADGCGPLALTYALARDDDGRWRRAVREPDQVRVSGLVRRDPQVLRAALPIGPTLRDRLLAACADGERAPVVELLRRWLELASHNPFATAENVIVTGGGLRVWDASYSVSVDVPTDVATARCLRLFTRALAEDGHAHPWPESADPDQLAVLLAAAAGAAMTEASLGGARELEAQLRDAGAYRNASSPWGLAGARELRAGVHRLRRQVDELRDAVTWYEERLTSTETELRLARLRAAGRLPITHQLASLARAGKRTVRDVLGRLGLLAWARRRLRAGRPRRGEAGP